MKKSFNRGSRLDRAEQKVGLRPDPNEAENLREVFDIIDHLVHLRSCGCDAAAKMLDFVMAHFVEDKDRTPEKQRFMELELAKLDKAVEKWRKANPELWIKELMAPPDQKSGYLIPV